MRERSFAIIKPDAVAARKQGKIIDALLVEGFDIVEMRQVWLDTPSAERFYAIHAGKKFFRPLVEFITSGPLIALQVEGEDAVAHLRRFVGAANPRTAEREGFLRTVMGKLSNERFVANAPAAVVENERNKQRDAEAKLAAIRERIAALK